MKSISALSFFVLSAVSLAIPFEINELKATDRTAQIVDIEEAVVSYPANCEVFYHKATSQDDDEGLMVSCKHLATKEVEDYLHRSNMMMYTKHFLKVSGENTLSQNLGVYGHAIPVGEYARLTNRPLSEFNQGNKFTQTMVLRYVFGVIQVN